MSVSIFSLTILSRQVILIFYVSGPALLDLNDSLHVAFGFKYAILSQPYSGLRVNRVRWYSAANYTYQQVYCKMMNIAIGTCFALKSL